jgi:hypothetical protein
VCNCTGFVLKSGPGQLGRSAGRFWDQIPHSSRPALGPTQPPVQRVPGLLYGVKQPRCGVEHTLYSANVKERVEHTSTPPWAFVACSEVNLTFSCTSDQTSGSVTAPRSHKLLSDSSSFTQAAQWQFLVHTSCSVTAPRSQLPIRNTARHSVLRVSHILAITVTIVSMLSVRYARRQKTQLPT